MSGPNDLTLAPAFIETQFPVSRLSKESYKERKANYSQMLTGLGKWWWRKPLVLVRAAILGLLLPATDDPQKDREVFLKLMTMDGDGLRRRKSKNIPLRDAYALLTDAERAEWFVRDADPERPKFKKGMNSLGRPVVQAFAFSRLTYDEKLEWCDRPEHLDGPSEQAWVEINSHLGTHARSLPELVRELGERRFGHAPRLGDAFCGGGSVPFEAARLGCDAYGSDLNPVAALLTWGALNIVGGGPEVAKRVREAQEKVYAQVDRQITEWGIEHGGEGNRADAYLYCTETRCPECGFMVPMAPSWVIGEKTHTVARLVPDRANKRFEIEIQQGVARDDMEAAKRTATTRDSRLICPNGCESTPISQIRGDRRNEYGLRLWENDDLVPRPEHVFQERLYCIRWVRTWTDEDRREQQQRWYAAPTAADLEREALALQLLRERFHEWQRSGYLPSRKIEPGDETTRLMRERGWTYWHHLFTPRQLLTNGLLLSCTAGMIEDSTSRTACLLGVGRSCDWNSRLCRWWTDAAHEKVIQTFSNQALNTLSSFAGRGLTRLTDSWFVNLPHLSQLAQGAAEARDARSTVGECDAWITDPPYADAINYHELSEFFLAWYEKSLSKLFPKWYGDSKRALAVRGSDEDFRRAMVDCYKHLAAHMPENGLQIVMFTHQDAALWADLALILWAAGLRVTAAWTVATETPFGVKEGDYVQGTVLMVLRKQTSNQVAFLDEIPS
jgi:putative DNA methylase